MSDNLVLRRATLEDVAAITSFVQEVTRSRLGVDKAEVTEWLYGKGLWVALEDDALVGVAAWQAENLVSVTDVFCISPQQTPKEVGSRLLETIEAEAGTLMCEINAVLLPLWAPETTRASLQQQGYEPKGPQELHRFWREVLNGFATEERELLVKKLRDRMVMVPV